MDVSETYIKMRVAAIPDLGYGEPLESTYRSENHYALENDEYSVFISPDGNWHVFHPDIKSKGISRACQLERQDQLQEMVGGCASFLEYHKCWSENSILQNLIHLFMFFLFESDMGGDFGNGDIYVKQFSSMEQLWLAFVMKELHNKVWNGEWV